MKDKIKKAIFLFIFTFVFIALSEKYIGRIRTYGSPLHWDEVYDNIPEYLVFSTVISLAYLYFERKK